LSPAVDPNVNHALTQLHKVRYVR